MGMRKFSFQVLIAGRCLEIGRVGKHQHQIGIVKFSSSGAPMLVRCPADLCCLHTALPEIGFYFFIFNATYATLLQKRKANNSKHYQSEESLGGSRLVFQSGLIAGRINFLNLNG